MLDVRILDVGHGNAAVFSDGDQALIVDAGSGTALLEHLAATGITRVAAVFISHADTDHLKGLIALLDQDAIQIDAVYVNSDAAKESRQWKALVYALDERNREGTCEFVVHLTEGLSLELATDATAHVLAPRQALAATGPGTTDDEGRRITTNTISAVVRIAMPGKRVLLTGDVDEVGLSHLLATGVDVSADILVFPHHGGNVGAQGDTDRNSAFTERLLAAVGPSVVIFSIGRRTHLNPRPEIVRAVVAEPGRHVMCTQMSRHCFVGEVLPDEHLSDTYAAGRQRSHCCAGSVRLSPTAIEPSVETHAAFVSENATSPLCRQSGPP